MNKNKKYINPDVLDTIANISSDEVFTPPSVVNKMLDNLPKHLFSSPNTTFLDPCTKSGIFLREIVKRLIKGLENWEPDLEKRIKHILKNQVFGISTTGICHLMSKRSLYCSKFANDEFSLGEGLFENNDGNLIYNKRLTHDFDREGKCMKCGITYNVLKDRGSSENYAYYFIHKTKEQIKARFNNMQFDVIIGNPPYQMNDGGGTGSSATPIYQKFVEQAINLQPRYLTMIIPSRWFAGGKGLEDFRKRMLECNNIKEIVDYADSAECFPNVTIAGGVNYFLWQKDYNGECKVTNIKKGEQTTITRKLNEYQFFVRDNEAINIINKVKSLNEKFYDDVVCSRNVFNLISKEEGHKTKKANDLVLYSTNGKSYIEKKSVTDRFGLIDKYKVMITKAMSGGNKPSSDGSYQVVSNTMRVLMPGEVCTETYLVVDSFDVQEQAENMKNYIKTKFFRFLLLQALTSINISKDKFLFIPVQDYNETWTDEKLFQKYNLSNTEIMYIENIIKTMEG